MELSLELDEEPILEPEPKKEEPSLTEKELAVLAFVEQIYWETGRVPTKEIVVQGLYPISSTRTKKFVEATWAKPRFQSALEKRGLEFKNDSKLLSPEQLLLVNMLLNVEDKKSLRQKLEMLGVKMAQYQTWLRDPAFHQYLTMRTEQLFENTDHDAYRALVRAVMGGDVTAMKLFFEMRGIYNPRLDININVETIVYRLVEIVGKHVKDPQILVAIADEVETLELPSRAVKTRI